MPQARFKFILAFLLLLHAPSLFGARNLLLAIGIDSYDDRYWGSLRFAGKDAEDITKALQPEFHDSFVLTSLRDPDRRVPRSRVRKAFAELAAANTAEDDVVIVYFSGHGTVGKTIEGGKTTLEKYLVTTDTDSQDPQSTGIAHKELLDFFEHLRSRRKVLILDSCYSGAGKSKLTREILRHLSQQKGPLADDFRDSAIEGSLILSASAFSEEAIESPNRQNGLYTWHLIQGFKADLNQDGAVSMTEAHSYASRKVMEESEGRQHPTARMEIVGGDPILVKGSARAGHPLLFGYDQLLRKLKIEINGKPLDEQTKGGVAVPPGTHQLKIWDQAGQLIYERDIHVKEGHEYSLANFLEYDPLYALSFGPAVTWLHEPRLRQKLGAEPVQGWSLRFGKEHIRGSAYDLELEAFTASDERMIDSQGLRVRESLRWHELGIRLGRQWKGADFRLAGTQKDADYFVKLNAGPHILWVAREVHDEGYTQPRQSLRAPALAAAAEWGWEQTSANLQIGLRYELAAAKVAAQDDFPDIWLWSRLALGVGLVF